MAKNCNHDIGITDEEIKLALDASINFFYERSKHPEKFLLDPKLSELCQFFMDKNKLDDRCCYGCYGCPVYDDIGMTKCYGQYYDEACRVNEELRNAVIACVKTAKKARIKIIAYQKYSEEMLFFLEVLRYRLENPYNEKSKKKNG